MIQLKTTTEMWMNSYAKFRGDSQTSDTQCIFSQATKIADRQPMRNNSFKSGNSHRDSLKE
jgi:hypothetical protein